MATYIYTSLFVSGCHNTTIWHNILVGVYASQEEAEARLREVDRADLIAWLDEAQRQTRRWQRCFRGLVADIRELRERQQESNEDDKQDSRFRTLIHRLPDEILQGPDPLGAILDKNRNQEKTDGGEICHQPIGEPRGVVGIECGKGLEVSFEHEVA